MTLSSTKEAVDQIQCDVQQLRRQLDIREREQVFQHPEVLESPGRSEQTTKLANLRASTVSFADSGTPSMVVSAIDGDEEPDFDDYEMTLSENDQENSARIIEPEQVSPSENESEVQRLLSPWYPTYAAFVAGVPDPEEQVGAQENVVQPSDTSDQDKPLSWDCLGQGRYGLHVVRQERAQDPMSNGGGQTTGHCTSGKPADSAGETSSSSPIRSRSPLDFSRRASLINDLKLYVQDWKGVKLEKYGDLLLFESAIVTPPREVRKPKQRECRIYLFESIILAVRDVTPASSTSRKSFGKVFGKSVVQQSQESRKLGLSGRIKIQDLTTVIPSMSPGSYNCQIFWRGDPGIQNFSIHFEDEASVAQWHRMITNQQRIVHDSESQGCGGPI